MPWNVVVTRVNSPLDRLYDEIREAGFGLFAPQIRKTFRRHGRRVGTHDAGIRGRETLHRIVGHSNRGVDRSQSRQPARRRSVKLTKTVLAQSRVPIRAGSAAAAAAAATAASYPQAQAAPAATTTSATTMSCTAAAPAAAYMAAAHVAATAMASAASAMASAASAPSAASPCKPYAGAKFSFFVENVKGPQAHIKHFLLGEKNSLPRVLGRHVCCRRVCRCTAHHRQRDPGSRPHG
jgi:hypothetical protein